MIIYFPLLVALIGLLLYILCTPPPNGPKLAELGRIMFFVGLFVFLLRGLDHLITVLK